MADNDQFRILVGGTSTNAGFVEIATADDGTEPIHVRQYTGVFSSLTRTATLLDGSGNTSFPGTVSAAFSGNLTGTASFATFATNAASATSATSATTATNLSNTGTVTLASATEANAITITQPSYTTDQPVKLLNFAWYSDVWSLGNIRSSSSPSNGFGIYLNSTESVRINMSGNVGIGNKSPEAALQVAKIGTDDQLVLGSAATNRDIAMFMYSGTTKAEVLRFQSATNFLIGSSAAIGNIHFNPGGSLKMIVQSGGNVGIGTTSPNAPLQVVGTGGGGIGIINMRGSNSHLGLMNSSGTFRGWYGYFNASAHGSEVDLNIKTGYNGASNIRFSADGDSTAAMLYISGSGFVGVGTTSPLNLLHLQNGNATYSTPESTNVPNLYIYNSNSSSTSAHSILTLRTNNTGGGNPFISFDVNQVTGYSMGVDNADSDKFKLANNWSSLSSNTLLTVTTGGNVGIGTPNPSYTLQVNGSGYFNTTLYVNGATTVDDNFYVTNGIVGIGTTSPSAVLDVVQTLSAGAWTRIVSRDASSSAAFIGVYRNSSTYSAGIFSHNSALNAWGDLWVNAHNDGSGGIAGGTANKVIIAGNVGIGTTVPGAMLDVNGDIYVSGVVSGRSFPFNTTIGSGADATTTTIRAGSTSGFQSAIFLEGGNVSNTIRFNTASAERMRITSGGNVGIGITAPTAKLHLVNADAGSDGLVFQKWAYTAGTTGVYELILKQTVTSGVVRYNFSMINASTAYNDVLVLDRGNVGIGTSSPSQALHVVGNLFIDDDDTTGNGVMLEAADRPLITRGWDPFTSGNKNGVGRWGVYMESAELFIGCPGTDYTNGLVTIGGWLLNGTRQPNLTVNNLTRYVGIGTTIPTSLLHVAGTVSYGSIRVTPSSANGESAIAFFTDTAGTDTNDSWVVGHAGWGNTGDFVIGNENNGAGGNVRLLIEKGGNVGIGTTSPSGRLHVYQSAATDTYLESGTSGTSGKLYFKTSDNSDLNKYIMQEAYYMLFNGHANEGFKFRDSNGTTLMTIYGTNNTYAGRVGIGTTAPSFPLDVNGPGRFKSNSSSRVLYLLQDGTNAGNIIQFQDQTGANVGEIVFRNNQFYVYSNAIGGFIMYANPATGNVGIKTSSISYALDVSGDIRATGDVIAYSDARVKENVKTIEAPLDLVTKLRGVTYTRNDSEDKSRKVGVIAQEVLPILPEVVQQDDNGNYSVAYGNMVGVLIEAIKEQQKQIDELKYLLQNK
jgi:hypothetical protein